MKRHYIKTQFTKRFSSEGTVYKKGYVVSQHILDTFKLVTQSQAVMSETTHTERAYLNKPLIPQDGVVYMNTTQAGLFYTKMCRMHDVDCDLKRANPEGYNVCLVIQPEKSFRLYGQKFVGYKMELTQRESDAAFDTGLTSIGISNYTDRANSITSYYDYDEFFIAARRAGIGHYDVFLMNGKTKVIPCKNELFECTTPLSL